MKRLLFALFVSTAAAFAQAQPEPSPEALKAAEALTETLGMGKQGESGMLAMIPMIENLARKLQLSEAETAELKGIYKAWYNEDLDQAKLRREVTKLYAQSFTVAELAELSKFYESPIGQKTIVAIPQIMQKSSVIGMQEAQSKQALLQARLQPFMEKHRPKTPAPGQAPQPAPPAPGQ